MPTTLYPLLHLFLLLLLHIVPADYSHGVLFAYSLPTTPCRLLPVDYCLMTTSYLLPSPYLYQLLYLFLLLLSIVPVDYSLLTTSDRLLNDYYSLSTTPYPILHTEYSLPDTSCFQFYIYTHFYFYTYIVSGLPSIHLPVL